jgi:hypothetical protein
MIDLYWNKIQSFKNIADASTGKGIYIYGFFPGADFLPYYVGKAKNIKYRLVNHMSSFLGGGNTIYDSNYLKEIYFAKRYSSEWEKHRLANKDKLVDFINHRYDDLRKHIDEMVNNFHFTFAALDNDEKLKQVENSVINQLGIEYLANQQSWPIKELVHINKGDLTVVNILEFYKKRIDKIDREGI